MAKENAEERMNKSMAAVKASAPCPKPATASNVAAAISPGSVKPAARQPQAVDDAFGYDVACNLAFIGSGQAGGRLANAVWNLGYRRCCAFNTTDADFNGLDDAMPKLSLDVGGAMKDTELARQAMRGREEDVHDLMAKAWGTTWDYALVCAGLGGGTGSGTAPELVKIARKHMEDKGLAPRVGAIVALPPLAEGFQVCRNAVTGFQRLLELKVSPLIVIDNAKVNLLFRPPMSKLHETANSTVAQMLHLFNQLGAVHSQLLTFDRSELVQLLDSGLVTMGSANIDVASINNPVDVSKAIREQLTGNVLAEVDLASSRKAACLFVASQDVLDKLSLDFFDAGYTALDRIMSVNAGEAATVVHRGLYLGTQPGLQAYVMLGELSPPKGRLSELARKGGLLPTGAGSSIASFLGVDDQA